MDFVQRAFASTRNTAFTLGISTVVVTHAAMVTGMLLPGTWNEAQKANHSLLNLSAAAAILYGTGLL